jgi:hypothetical protein
MQSRKERLRKLVDVQERLKAFHEMRRASFLAGASAAEREATEIASRFDAPGSLSDLFPDLYARRIEAALTRRDRQAGLARAEATLVATATARVNLVGRSWREAVRRDERAEQEKATLEAVERGLLTEAGDSAGGDPGERE